MNVLLVAKLSNQTLTENILSPLLKSSYVDHVYVLRDFPGDMIDGKVTYLFSQKGIGKQNPSYQEGGGRSPLLLKI